MIKWKKYRICEIGTVVGGATPSTRNLENYIDGDIAWITPKDLSSFNNRYIEYGERNITAKGLNSCSTQILPKGTVLFSSRAPIGYMAIASNDVCTNQGFKSVIPNDNVDSLFLYYLLKYNKMKIEALAGGTTFKEVSGSTMKNVEVYMPDNLKEQKRIADILGRIDDKIELNTKINNNLEQQAMAIYKQFFVCDINQKWKQGILSDVADIIMGQSPSGTSLNTEGDGSRFFQGRSDFSFRFPNVRLFTTDPKRMASTNDILMSVRAPVGDLNVAHKECCIGRGLAAIRSKSNHQSFIFYTLRFLKRKLDTFNSEGTVFGSINKQALNNLPILIPPTEKLDEFEALVSLMDSTIRNNYNEIHYLNQIRDTLLPELLSGELDVSNIDI